MLDTLNADFAAQLLPDPRYWLTGVLAAMEPHRQADGYELHLATVPDDSNIAVSGGGTYEGRVTLPPGSRLWGISASSILPDGFDLQIRNASVAQPFCGRRTFYPNMSGQVQPGDNPKCPLFFLPRPMLFGNPGQVVVQVWNRGADVNSIQVVLWFMQRKPR